MRSFTPLSFAPAALLLVLAPAAHSHGGTYPGPGDVVPPGGAGGSPGGGAPAVPGTGGVGAPSPAQPGTPRPGQPVTPQPVQPGVAGPAVSPGVELGPDLTEWSFWWEFNKNSYLNLRASLRSIQPVTGSMDWYLGKNTQDQALDRSKPRKSDLEELVVPALLRTLEQETHNDIVTGCLMSLAKIGGMLEEDGSSPFEDTIAGYLRDSNQEISETAALALGILGQPSSLEVLGSLVADGPEGRDLVGRGEVPRRTRAFAVYALGLIARQAPRDEVRQEVFELLTRTLVGDDSSSRDLSVACVNALGLFTFDGLGAEARSEEASGLTGQVAFLLGYLEEESNNAFPRAHVPAALGRIWKARGAELGEAWRLRILGDLLDLCEARDTEKEVRRGTVLALGQLADRDSDTIDERARKFLIEGAARLSDPQVRRFAVISMAQVAARTGSDDVGLKPLKAELLKLLSGSKSGTREWAALGLGILGHDAPDDLTPELVTALRTCIEDQRGPRVAAYAVAAGLMGSEDLTSSLLEQLDRIQDDTARGYLCLALGLIGDSSAVSRIEEVLHDSSFRSELLRQAAIGLGLLAGHEATSTLVQTLADAKSLTATAAIAKALGLVGDRRSLAALVEILADETRPDLARGLAAAALGSICSPSLLPWNEPISRDINYRSATETLTGLGGRGILDIL